MQNQEKIEAIRAACIAANEDIMKLQFGCEVKAHEDTKDEEVYTILKKHGNFWMCASLQREDCGTSLHGENAGFRVLGRPIRLADVLLAIVTKQNGTSKHTLVGSAGLFCEMSGGAVRELGAAWNLLKDDLTDQSPETIDFLFSLLKA